MNIRARKHSRKRRKKPRLKITPLSGTQREPSRFIKQERLGELVSAEARQKTLKLMSMIIMETAFHRLLPIVLLELWFGQSTAPPGFMTFTADGVCYADLSGVNFRSSRWDFDEKK
jgi:hypothetical protein